MEFKDQYPIFCRNVYCGIEVGPGWEKLVSMFCSAVEQTLRQPFNDETPQLAQVKEKFGTLTIYIDNSNNEIEWLRRAICLASTHICEDCGNFNSTTNPVTRKGQWIKTYCEECHTGTSSKE